MVNIIFIICCIIVIISGVFQGRYDREVYHKTIDLQSNQPSWWPYNEWNMSLTACITNYLAIASIIALLITCACCKTFPSIFTSEFGIFSYIGFLILTIVVSIIIRSLAKIIAATSITLWLKKFASTYGIRITNQCF